MSERTFNKIKQLANENNLNKCEIIDKALYFLEEIYSNKVPQFKAMKEYLIECNNSFRSLCNSVSELTNEQKQLVEALIKIDKQ